MPAPVIRAHYDDLGQIATTFERHGELTRKSLQGLRRQQASLEAGDWLGLGAQAFYAEMNSQVVPAMNRLIGALEQAAGTTRQIHKIMQQAEADAAAVFRTNGAASAAAPTGGAPLAAGAGDGTRGTAGGTGAAAGMRTVSGGTPFARGAGDTDDISPNDVSQGQLGDCFLMASLAGIAQVNPDVIRNMIKDNGDGSYTVTFKITTNRIQTLTGKHIDDYYAERGMSWMLSYPYGSLHLVPPTILTKEIRVTPDFPADSNGQPIYAHYGDTDASGKPEIWVPLIEKANAQMRGDYSDMNGGYASNALSNITGRPTIIFSPDETTLDELADFHSKGSAIVMDTPKYTTQMALFEQMAGRYSIVPDHSYFVTRVDKTAGTVSLRNPWGWNEKEVTLSMNEFNAIFTRGSISPTR